MFGRVLKVTVVLLISAVGLADVKLAEAGWPFHCHRRHTTSYATSNYVSNAQQAPAQTDQAVQQGLIESILVDELKRRLLENGGGILGGNGGGLLGSGADMSGVHQKLDTLIAGQEEIKGGLVNNASISQALGRELVTVSRRIVAIQDHLKIKEAGSESEVPAGNEATPIQQLTASIQAHSQATKKYQASIKKELDLIKKALDKKADKPVPTPAPKKKT